MQVNLHDAKTNLSRYVEQALDGDDVVIARAGKPLVKLVPVDTTPRRRQLGFMRSQGVATADVKGDFVDDINAMFS
jgi:prevent-host-death family protein